MTRALFVSNGHGEIAIAQRIGSEVEPAIPCDHLALVGDSIEPGSARLTEVGPRRAMPSGGLLAMGNARNIARDVAAGLIAHTIAQLRFLKSVRGRYCAAIAVGDVYALMMALRARAPSTVFVGTAKSVRVAAYGRLERAIIAKSSAVFVRDEPTAIALRRRGIAALGANVIVDLYDGAGDGPRVAFAPQIALFPGSRETAYRDAVTLCRIVRALAVRQEQLGALLSIAPSLDPRRMAEALRADGWTLSENGDASSPFSLTTNDREVVRSWRGALHPLLRGTDLVLGQAGTANEAAAAAGIPLVAVEAGKPGWYRKRQMALLGDAMLVVDETIGNAAPAILHLLNDPQRRASMASAGRERMGPPGGAKTIAEEVVRLCE